MFCRSERLCPFSPPPVPSQTRRARAVVPAVGGVCSLCPVVSTHLSCSLISYLQPQNAQNQPNLSCSSQASQGKHCSRSWVSFLGCARIAPYLWGCCCCSTTAVTAHGTRLVLLPLPSPAPSQRLLFSPHRWSALRPHQILAAVGTGWTSPPVTSPAAAETQQSLRYLGTAPRG